MVKYLVVPMVDTNAYTSVVLADGSRVMRGASIWLDATALPEARSNIENVALVQAIAKARFGGFMNVVTLGLLVTADRRSGSAQIPYRSKLFVKIVPLGRRERLLEFVCPQEKRSSLRFLSHDLCNRAGMIE